jgi:hypothetical protein
MPLVRRLAKQAGRNRPIDSDSCQNRAKSESRELSFEIKSEKF